jgi:methylmalonyl-CoA mutase cobalamin-binding subunit
MLLSGYVAESGLDADVEVCQVEEAVRHFEQITGRRPRILIAKMG